MVGTPPPPVQQCLDVVCFCAMDVLLQFWRRQLQRPTISSDDVRIEYTCNCNFIIPTVIPTKCTLNEFNHFYAFVISPTGHMLRVETWIHKNMLLAPTLIGLDLSLRLKLYAKWFWWIKRTRVLFRSFINHLCICNIGSVSTCIPNQIRGFFYLCHISNTFT